MKKTFFITGMLTAVIVANALLTTTGCSSGSSSVTDSSHSLTSTNNTDVGISNRYAMQPSDMSVLTQNAADSFGWQSFIAMNWPANAATCGPDTANGKSILHGDGPRVWETYLSTDQVFVSAPAQPDGWCMSTASPKMLTHMPSKVQALARKTGVYRFIHRNSKFPNKLEQALGGPLVDQNGRFVRYEVRMNQDEYNYIVAKKLWNSAGQSAFPKDSIITMPAGPTTYGPTGAMEFKAAWKVLGKGDDTNKFYKIRAIVYNDNTDNPSPGENPVTLGLVGLHIGHKTARQTNWVWATFEQVDNLTTSFNNPHCNCTPNLPLSDHTYVELNPDGTPRNKPTQVTRVNPVGDPIADSLNNYFRQMLKGSVWANYELVSTQWIEFGLPRPSFLTNTTMETYTQGPNPPSFGNFKVKLNTSYFTDNRYRPFAPGVSSSCMACHYVATLPNSKVKSDFSFILGEAH